MKPYLLSLGAGLVVGIVYSLLNVRSPAPPVIALVGLFGILAGEQVVPLAKRLIASQGISASTIQEYCGAHMFEPSLAALARRGRQLAITSVGDRRVSLDLLDFYHNESRLFGVDTRHRDAVASARLLDALTPVFEQGAFKAPKVDRVIPLSNGAAAYEQVARGEAKGRLVLVP